MTQNVRKASMLGGSGNRPVAGKDQRRPVIVLVGEEERLVAVDDALSDLDALRQRAGWSADLVAELDDDVAAVVLVGPIPRVPIRVAVGRLRESAPGRRIAFVAVVPDETADAQVRRIYDRGASAVFFWPREANVLPRCLVEMIAMLRVRGKPSKPDQALARAVRAHLRLLPGIDASVRVEANQGILFLSGETSFLWKKQVAVDAAASVAGVKSVVARDLRVARADVTDRSLAARVQRLLRDTAEVDETTLAVRIEQGHATLAGTVANRHELHRIVDLLANVRGIRSIDRLAVISERQQQRDRSAAKRLREAIAAQFPDEDVTVSFFGEAAELTGSVDRAQRKQQIERAVAEQDVVERVINKIDVPS